MGMQNTTLVNETDEILVVYEVTSNGAQARLKELKPKPRSKSESSSSESNVANLYKSHTGETKVVDNPDFSVQSAVDPSDSYKTLRVWHEREAVLGVSTDEMMDNELIVIKFENGGFTKTLTPRSSKSSKVMGKVKEMKDRITSKVGGPHTGGQEGDKPSSSEQPSTRNFGIGTLFKASFKK